jgi:hypothetical protein
MNGRSKLRRWHIWLAWVAAVPVLLWIVSGLVMVARPIEEVRGEGLLLDKSSIGGPVRVKLPALEHADLRSLTLESRVGGARWIMVLADGGIMLFDPRTGRRLPPISAADAVREVDARYTGKAKIVGVRRLAPGSAPIEYRGKSPTWQVRMSDDTHFYVDSGTGDIVATRTRWWRFYDLMWGFHIMDLKTREDTHNPLVIGFGLIALAVSLIGIVLLPKTLRRKGGRETA